MTAEQHTIDIKQANQAKVLLGELECVLQVGLGIVGIQGVEVEQVRSARHDMLWGFGTVWG